MSEKMAFKKTGIPSLRIKPKTVKPKGKKKNPLSELRNKDKSTSRTVRIKTIALKHKKKKEAQLMNEQMKKKEADLWW